MSVTPLTPEEITTMLAKLRRVLVGKGKSVHLAKSASQYAMTLCGRASDVQSTTDGGDTCKRCYAKAESNYRYERKISYGCMRDAELDRMTYGGQPFTEAEEKETMAEYMEYAGRTTDADIAILTADGFVECTPEMLGEALAELAKPSTIMSNSDVLAYDAWCKGESATEESCVSFIGTGPTENGEVTMFATPTRIASWIESGYLHQHTPEQTPTHHAVCQCPAIRRSVTEGPLREDESYVLDALMSGVSNAYARVVNPDGIDGPMSGQFDDYDYASDEVKFAAMNAGTATMCAHGRVIAIQDGPSYECTECVEDAGFDAEFYDEFDAEYERTQHEPMDESTIVGDPSLATYNHPDDLGDLNGAFATEWHVFTTYDNQWHTMSYSGYAPICIMLDGMCRDLEYRHTPETCHGICPLGEDTSAMPVNVSAHLVIDVNGASIDLGWHTFIVQPFKEKSIATLYGERHGEWKRPTAPDWDSIITVVDTETY